MNGTKLQHNWDKYFEFYTTENLGRPTRLGFFEPNSDSITDYWIECGEPFGGISLSTDGKMPVIRLIVGKLTHEARRVVKMSSHLTATGDEDGVDILDADGCETILRFERDGIPPQGDKNND